MKFRLMMMREKLGCDLFEEIEYLRIIRNQILDKWKEFLDKLKYPKSKVTIGLIGKYIELQDAYKSILEALFMPVR